MHPDHRPLPATVLQALENGHTIEAIKRLRAAEGLGLKEAKDIIDAHLQGRPMVRAHPGAAPMGFSAGSGVPPAVLQALAAGNKIEAIRLLREHAGIGLKEAKDRVDALAASTGNGGGSAGNLPGLAPGEQPHGSSALGWIVVALVVGVAAWYLLQRAG